MPQKTQLFRDIWGLSVAQLKMIDFATQRAVEMAEQLFLSGQLPKDERKKAALRAAAETLRDTGLVPERYMEMIDHLIEAAVRGLSKTSGS